MGLCEDYLDDLDSAYHNAETALGYLRSIISWMNDWYDVATEENWRLNVIGAFTRCANCIGSLVYGEPHEVPPFRVPYMFRNCVGGADVTMASIIMAMYAATPQELLDFIGIEDAYRQSLWNKPFPKAYFAELARGFETWE